MRKRNTTIDFAKYIAALLVIAIHTGLLQGINDTMHFVVVEIIGRLAVPFFAICTGYFLAVKLDSGENAIDLKNKVVIIKQWKKVLNLYLFWSVIYLVYSIPNWLDTGWFSIYAFIDFGIAAIKNGSHYHLWYILSLLYALPIVWICLRSIYIKKLPYVIVILWMIKAVSYAYTKWLPLSIAKLFRALEFFSGIRDALFCILPLLLVGVCIKNQKKKEKRFYSKGFFISLTCLVIEALLLCSKGQTAVSYIIFTLPTAFFLFNLLLKTEIPVKGSFCIELGSASVLIYCMHPMFIEVFKDSVNNSVYLFIIVSSITSILGITVVKLRGKRGKG